MVTWGQNWVTIMCDNHNTNLVCNVSQTFKRWMWCRYRRTWRSAWDGKPHVGVVACGWFFPNFRQCSSADGVEQFLCTSLRAKECRGGADDAQLHETASLCALFCSWSSPSYVSILRPFFLPCFFLPPLNISHSVYIPSYGGVDHYRLSFLT